MDIKNINKQYKNTKKDTQKCPWRLQVHYLVIIVIW